MFKFYFICSSQSVNRIKENSAVLMLDLGLNWNTQTFSFLEYALLECFSLELKCHVKENRGPRSAQHGGTSLATR